MKIKIKFHYTFIIMSLGFVLTGYFSNLLIFTSIILIHEMGHFIIAKILNFKPKKIVIYPYGGITILENKINRSINKELLIAISGIIFQTIYIIFIIILYKNNVIREYIYNLFIYYNTSIIIFNILPIHPLDGSKIINLLLSKIINYKLANKLTVFISLLTILILMITHEYIMNYSYIMIISVLLTNIYKYYSKLEYIYNKFLLERYLYNIKYKNTKIINNKNKMFKNYNHIIKHKTKYMKEHNYLSKIFDLSRKL